MSNRCACPMCLDMRARWDAIAADIAAGKPSTYRCTQHGVLGWCEACEAQIAHAADTYDPESGRSRPLLRRRGR